jgi:hypothetical protein
MKRNHWFGELKSKFENPHRSSRVQWFDGFVASELVVFGHGQRTAGVTPCTFGVVRMQGTNLEPMLIWMYVDGPIMGLNCGCIMIGEPVTMEFLMISAMKTEICISDNVKTTHGVLPEKKPLFFIEVGCGTKLGP